MTDFGLQELRNSGDCVSEEDLPISYNVNKKLWRAPELLRDEKLNIKGTQKGDVYAFGEQALFFLQSTNFENDFFVKKVKSWKLQEMNFLCRPLAASSITI